MSLSNRVINHLNAVVEPHTKNSDSFTLVESAEVLEFSLSNIPLRDPNVCNNVADLAPPSFLESKPSITQYHSAVRELVSLGYIDRHEANNIKLLVSQQEDSNFANLSFSMPVDSLRLRSIYENVSGNTPVSSLRKEELLALIDKTRLCSLWHVDDFIETHKPEIVEGNVDLLMRSVEANETLILRESQVVKFIQGKRESLSLKELQELDKGRVPSEYKDYIGHSVDSHRVYASGESFLVFSKDDLNPKFPVGAPGTSVRKAEINVPLRVFTDHMSSLGAGITFQNAWRSEPSMESNSLVVIPTREQAESMFLSFLDKAVSEMKNARSNFHIDVSRGPTISSFIVAGVKAETLAKDLTNTDLRKILLEQRAETEYYNRILKRSLDVSIPSQTNNPSKKEGENQKSTVYDELIKNRSLCGGLSSMSLLTLRNQFQGLSEVAVFGRPELLEKKEVPGILDPVFVKTNSSLLRQYEEIDAQGAFA